MFETIYVIHKTIKKHSLLDTFGFAQCIEVICVFHLSAFNTVSCGNEKLVLNLQLIVSTKYWPQLWDRSSFRNTLLQGLICVGHKKARKKEIVLRGLFSCAHFTLQVYKRISSVIKIADYEDHPSIICSIIRALALSVKRSLAANPTVSHHSHEDFQWFIGAEQGSLCTGESESIFICGIISTWSYLFTNCAKHNCAKTPRDSEQPF